MIRHTFFPFRQSDWLGAIPKATLAAATWTAPPRFMRRPLWLGPNFCAPRPGVFPTVIGLREFALQLVIA